MKLRESLLNLERAIDRLTGPRAVREPLEIRRAIVGEIVRLAKPVGRSRRLMPFGRIVVHVAAATPAEGRILDEVLTRNGGLEGDVARELTQAGGELPQGFRIAVKYVRKARADWPADRPFHLTGEVTPSHPAPAAGKSSPASRPTALILTVLKGRAARKVIRSAAPRLNIGRTAEVTGKDRRLHRRNDIVFLEDSDEINRTVSRAHAHIWRVESTGELRVRDDNSAYGTRILRDGRTIEVSAGNPRGVKLRAGDEIYFGNACVRLEIEDARLRSSGGSE